MLLLAPSSVFSPLSFEEEDDEEEEERALAKRKLCSRAAVDGIAVAVEEVTKEDDVTGPRMPPLYFPPLGTLLL